MPKFGWAPWQCRIERDLNRLLCLQKNVHLWVEFSRPDTEMRIAGLIYPDIELARGATLTVTAMTLSPGLGGAFVISRVLRPPYPDLTATTAPAPWAGFPREICGISHHGSGCVKERALPPPLRGNIYTATLLYRVQRPGVVYYCNFSPWRPRAGDWGRIMVVP
ncbi:MAG: hypothetical protein ACRD01_07285 [Terriglobales bacterium]